MYNRYVKSKAVPGKRKCLFLALLQAAVAVLKSRRRRAFLTKFFALDIGQMSTLLQDILVSIKKSLEFSYCNINILYELKCALLYPENAFLQSIHK